jgi:hypothetical protein
MGLNLDEFKSEGPHDKHAVATWNLGTISVFASRQGKTNKTCIQMAGRRIFRVRTDF